MSFPTANPRAGAQAPPVRATTPALPGVGLYQPSQSRAAGDALAKAFWDDPIFLHAEPDGERRARALPGPFRTLLRYGHRYGHVQTLADGRGAAIWVKPGAYPIPAGAMLRSRFYLWRWHMGKDMLGRVEAALGTWDAAHQRAVPGRHWYLWVLGLDPPLQGRGLGPRLMAPVLARADAEGLPCYLETTRPRNVAFYQRQGFEVAEQGEEPVPWWAMRRAPRAPARASPGRP